ncbi:MAG: hypothetical protein ACOY0T_33185 [Myxococcota bacterium]
MASLIRLNASKSLCAIALLVSTLSGCGATGGVGEAAWPPLGKKWYERADASFHHGDMEDAREAIDNALKVVPDRPEARLLSAKVALASLDYDRVQASLRGLDTSEARSLRGRAFWYAGEVEKAADELEKLLSDPEVRDPWANEIAKLARVGAGRKPFDLAGGMLASTEMPRAGTSALIVPLELNGEPALGLVATGTAEAVIDSSAGARPSWVSLRFGERLEVRDVPVLAKDLSGISRQVNAPIKILLGVNLLRHLRPTFDFAGGQFVVRSFDPPPPPVATTIKLSYVRGGGMLVRGAFGADQAAPACSLLVDTALTYPLALSNEGWKKAGVSPASLQAVPGAGDLREGVLPMLRLGAYDVPKVPGLGGESAVKEREEGLGIALDGLIGSGLLASFRVTLVDGGRTMWLEDIPAEALNAPSLFANLPPVEEAPDAEVTEPENGKPGKGAPAKPGKPAPGGAAPAPAPAPAKPPAAPGAAPAGTKPPAASGNVPAAGAKPPAAPNPAPAAATKPPAAAPANPAPAKGTKP